MMGRWGRRH